MTDNYAKRINSADIVFFATADGPPRQCVPADGWAVWNRKGLDPRFRVVGETSGQYAVRLKGGEA